MKAARIWLSVAGVMVALMVLQMAAASSSSSSSKSSSSSSKSSSSPSKSSPSSSKSSSSSSKSSSSSSSRGRSMQRESKLQRLLGAKATEIQEFHTDTSDAGSGGDGSKVCETALVTLYAERGFSGPRVSLGCSSVNLQSLVCFPVGSVAVKPGATAVLHSDYGYGGKSLVMHTSVEDVATRFPQFTFAASLSLCNAVVKSAVDECPENEDGALSTCPEETPLDEDDLVITQTSDPSHSYAGKFDDLSLFYFQPDHKFWFSPSPEVCFFKTFVREAQIGCLPHIFGFNEVAKFIPEYKGSFKGMSEASLFDAGEWLVLKNMAAGIEHPSVLDLDPAAVSCSRCGLNPLWFKTWDKTHGKYTGIDLSVPEEAQALDRTVKNDRIRAALHMLEAFLSGADPSQRKEIARHLAAELDKLYTALRNQKLTCMDGVIVTMLYGFSKVTQKMEAHVYLQEWEAAALAPQVRSGNLVPEKLLRLPPEKLEQLNEDKVKRKKYELQLKHPGHTDPQVYACGVQEVAMHMHEYSMHGRMAQHCMAACLQCSKSYYTEGSRKP